MSSDTEKEKEKQPEITPDQNDTVLELQLGDVIQISSPLNEVLNDQTYIIDYIDKSKAYLINTATMEKLRLPISLEGVIGDGNITPKKVRSCFEQKKFKILSYKRLVYVDFFILTKNLIPTLLW